MKWRREAAEWGGLELGRLRRSRQSSGRFSGDHASARSGPGIEFHDTRAYVAGDDLRRLDRRALLTWDRLLVRENAWETDRALYVVVDDTRSMAYRGTGAELTKFEWACSLAWGLGILAQDDHSPVSFVLPGHGVAIGPSMRRDVLAGFAHACEQGEPGALGNDADYGVALRSALRSARKGSLVVFLSDLFGPSGALVESVTHLFSRQIDVCVFQTLDPDELRFPFEGELRLESFEDESVVELDAHAARPQYLANLASLTDSWSLRVRSAGGIFASLSTEMSPASALRRAIL